METSPLARYENDESESFAAVMVIEALPHFVDYHQSVKEVFRVLKLFPSLTEFRFSSPRKPLRWNRRLRVFREQFAKHE